MKRLPTTAVCLCMAAVAMLATGCASTPDTGTPTIVAVPFPGADVVALTADDVVKILRQSGLSDAEILEVGPDFRNALSTDGGVRIKTGETVEALVVVEADRLHISSRRTGSFIFRVGGASPATRETTRIR